MDRFTKEKDIVDKLFNKDIYKNFNFNGKEYKRDKYNRRIVLVKEDLEGKKISISIRKNNNEYIVQASDWDGYREDIKFDSEQKALDYFEHIVNKYNIRPGYFEKE